MRVAAGGVARRVLGTGVSIRGALVQIGPHKVGSPALDDGRERIFRSDPVKAQWEKQHAGAGLAGAVIEVVLRACRLAWAP